MKKILFIVALVCSFRLAAQEEQDTLTPEQVTYEYFTGQTIELKDNEGRVYPEMKAGDKLVFQYSKRSAENPRISDDEMYESVVFEVDSSWKSFTFRKKIAQSKATYNLGCFCIGRGYYKVNRGTIKGRKLSNGNFYVEADLTVTYSSGNKRRIQFKGEFKAAHAG